DANRTTPTAPNHHHDALDRTMKIEAARINVSSAVGVEATSNAFKKCAEHKGSHLVTRRIDSDGFRCDLVIAYREKTAAIGGIDQTNNNIDRDCDNRVSPKNSRITCDAAVTTWPPYRVRVLNQNANDFAETESNDGKIIALQPQGGYADNEARNRSNEPTGD